MYLFQFFTITNLDKFIPKTKSKIAIFTMSLLDSKILSYYQAGEVANANEHSIHRARELLYNLLKVNKVIKDCKILVIA